MKKVIFIGNVPIEANKKDVIKHFSLLAKPKKIWYRSIPLIYDKNEKQPIKVQIIKNQINSNIKSKNCYISYESQEKAKETARRFHNTIFQGRHLVVTLANQKE